MKVCFPVNKNEGLESIPYGHFGTAPMFVVCDTTTNEVNTLSNGDLGHEHGMCQPLKALCGTKVDAIIVGGIGRGAIVKLNELGIDVYRAEEGNLSDNLNKLNAGTLKMFSINDTCNHHDCEHH